MKRKPDLSSVLAEAGGSTRRAPSPQPQAARQPQAQPVRQPGRVGTRPITVHFPKAVRDQLKKLAIDEDATVQDLVGEALNDLFRKYGRPEIAPGGRNP